MSSLMLSWMIGFASLGWLALRFCVATVLGLAIIIGSVVVWVVAALAIGVVGDVPQKRSL